MGQQDEKKDVGSLDIKALSSFVKVLHLWCSTIIILRTAKLGETDRQIGRRGEEGKSCCCGVVSQPNYQP